MSQTIPETVDEMLKLYSTQHAFNGAVLVATRGNILLQKGYGRQNAATDVHNTANTIFQTGSLTKQFTAALILRLRDEGKLTLQDKLSKYLPGYPNGDQITIEMLLTHTSGVFNYTNDAAFMRRIAGKPLSKDSLLASFEDKPLDFAPGASFGYSNSGYILLGLLIEKITGKSYFRTVREKILAPLKMDHSGFDFRSLKSPDKATGYLKLTAKSGEPATIVDSTLTYAAGSFYSTVTDLYKWDRSLYSHTLLSDSSLKEAFTPHRSGYGYGWIIDTSSGASVMMNGGTISGFSGFMAHIPVSETCIILLDNTSAPALARIGENINAILTDQPYYFPEIRQEIILDTATLAQYTGEYRFSADFSIVVTLENGELIATATGQGKNELFAEKDNSFFLRMVGERMEFLKGATGRVEKMILYQEDIQTTGMKVR